VFGGVEHGCGWDSPTSTCRRGFVTSAEERAARHESVPGGCVALSSTNPTANPTVLPTQSTPSTPQSISSEGGDDSDSSTIIIVVLVVTLLGGTLFFVVRDRSKTRQGLTNNQPRPPQPVDHAQRQPVPQVVPPVNNPAFTNPLYMEPNQMFEAGDTST